MSWLVQVDATYPEAWTRDERGETARACAIHNAATQADGTYEVYIADPDGPLHPNGAPIRVEVFTCQVQRNTDGDARVLV